MLFNSIEFALFLPIVFLLYWFVFNRGLRMQNLFVVVASYVFYGWWDWRFLLLIAFTSLCSWGCGMLMPSASDRRKKVITIVNIVINLLILVFFKYHNFFVAEFARLFHFNSDGLLLKVVLPVGVSFYTFQALSYSIDVYRGRIVPTRDIVSFFAYVSFFPQLVAGPIERATNLLPQFEKPRVFDYDTAVGGMRQILWGLFKKMVVADNCARYVDQVFENYQTHTGSTLLVAVILFAFQIYGDFSGYSDIAIGTSKLFGIRLMRNFNVPYFSRDIAEFWRRWHISLTTWFRDYIYIPLGGSRCSKAKIIRNTFVIFLISGLWHGANWTFLAWGVYHAVLFLPLILSGKNRKYLDVVARNRRLPNLKECGQMLLTFLLVVIGWIFFRSDSIQHAWGYICGICDKSLFSLPWVIRRSYYIPLIISILLLFVVEWQQRGKDYVFDLSGIKAVWVRDMIYLFIFFMLFVFGGHAQTFIYFQF